MAIGDNTYAEAVDVQRLIGDIVESRTFTTGTVPTLAQVEEELDNAASELNVALDDAGYTVPVDETDWPTAYEWIKAANTYGAAAVLLSTIPSDGYEPDEEVESPATTRAQTYGNKFKSALKRIEKNKLRAGRRKDRLADTFAGSQEDDDGNTKAPIFIRGMDDYPGRRSLTESD
jgi:hypothetical protein